MTVLYRPGTRDDIPKMRELWKEAFGDSDSYLDTFFSIAFSGRRSRVAVLEDQVVAAVYWFSATCQGHEVAYLYALAVRSDLRGQGIGSGLVKSVWEQLEKEGYSGTILVPGEPELIKYYAAMGYMPCAMQGRIKTEASGPSCNLKPVSPRRYGELRKELLPPGSVIQEGVSLEYQATQTRLYAGKNMVMSSFIREDGSLYAMELLAKDPLKAAQSILKTLHIGSGVFRVPYDQGRPYALFKPLPGWDGGVPRYFAFSFF